LSLSKSHQYLELGGRRRKSTDITLIMLIFNNGKTVSKTLKSLLKQSNQDFNFIIVDDSSTDNSMLEIYRLTSKFRNCTVIENEFNLGETENLRNAIRISLELYPKTEFISFIGPDDIYEPLWLETGFRKLNYAKKAIAFQSATKYQWDNGFHVLSKYQNIGKSSNIGKLIDIPRQADRSGSYSYYGNFIGGLIRRSFIEKYWSQNSKLVESFFILEDINVFLMISAGGIQTSSEVLMTKNKLISMKDSEYILRHQDSTLREKLGSNRSKIIAAYRILSWGFKNYPEKRIIMILHLMLSLWQPFFKPIFRPIYRLIRERLLRQSNRNWMSSRT